MDSANIKIASSYVNNLLLARGLLRNGKPIEFAHPSKGEGGRDATIAQIINLVHDLVLRRDREEEQREFFALTLRTLRANEKQHTVDMDRLTTQISDLHRRIAMSQAAERAAKSAMRTAEASARSLREETARLKTMFAQVRTQCNNDVRKRDVQIQRLKSHLTSQQRGSRTGLVGASITITPGSNGTGSAGATIREGGVPTAPGLADPEYSLKQETTEFLTQLSQSLSDENDALIEMVRGTVQTLREIGGMTGKQRKVTQDGGICTDTDQSLQPPLVQSPPTSYEELAVELNGVLDHLKTILTNPNFVSIEEVEIREDEIVRLREGWEKMEARWREAIALMDGWRKRMLSGGDTVNLDELKMGLGLGVGLGTADVTDNVVDASGDEEDLTIQDHGSELGLVGSRPEIECDRHRLGSSEGNIPRPSAKDLDLFDLNLKPFQPALQETNANAISPSKPRKVTFDSSHLTKQDTVTDENIPLEPEGSDDLDVLPSSPIKWDISVTSSPTKPRPDRFELSSPSPAHKPHSSPHTLESPPKLTVNEKLDAVQAEAELIAAGSPSVLASTWKASKDARIDLLDLSPIKPSIKKTRIGGRARRRKSTLTPEELERLIGL